MRHPALAAVALGLAFAAVGPDAAHAEFRDPLHTSAEQIGAMASQSRLLAVASAGTRLVAVGPRGHIVLSDDRGATWLQVEVPVSTDLVAVTFVDAQHGWACGHDGVILHTADGGRSWTKQLDGHGVLERLAPYFERRLGTPSDAPPPAIIDDGAMDGGSESTDVLAGATPSMNLEEARGLLTEGIDKAFFAIAFVSPQEGYAVGAYSLAFRTLDGGLSWEPIIDAVDNPRLLHLYGLAVTGDTVYLAGEQGLLTRLNRITQRFEALASPSTGSYFGVLAHNTQVVAFGLAGNVYRSIDAGATWTHLDAGARDGIVAGTGIDASRFALVTQSGGVLLGDDSNSVLSSLPVAQPMAYFGVASIAPGSLVLAGASGVRVESLPTPSR